MKKIIFITIILLGQGLAFAGESFIPLKKGLRIASNDLVSLGGEILTSRDADALAGNGLDLSLLNPKSNDVWSDEEYYLDDQNSISINEQDSLTYSGSILSNSGLFRFNANKDDDNRIYTIHLDKTLHTLLLRKNILRKLGYKIPALKYLKTIKIKFNTVEERESFLSKEVPEGTLGASVRWVSGIDNLTVTLKDIAISESSEFDFYNVAMGIPTQALGSRTIRSLVIPYSILDLYESVNQFQWIAGKIDNQSLILSHFTANDFPTTIEDAQWMFRKFAKLSREDIQKAVILSYFPEDVGVLVVEKIISRRNSLEKLLNEKKSEISFNHNISLGKNLVQGKIINGDYPGYASRFSHGDLETPFEDIRYVLFSKMQSIAFTNIVDKINENLIYQDLNETRFKYFKKQFEDGLNHFIKTGELKPIGVGYWTSPLLSANLIFSRDIVIGNYLGTDNIVQMADTFGASIIPGFQIGIEGIGTNLTSGIRVAASVVKTFTHVKPVASLKESLKTPYKNIFVNLLKGTLKEQFFSLYDLKNSSMANDLKNKKIQELLGEIDKGLNVGESLILTERLMPTADIKLNFNQGLLSAGVGAGANMTILKRIHILKKSPKVLQIFDDLGDLKDINLNFNISSYVQLLKITQRFDNGKYRVRSYNVNLSSDLDENPNLFDNAIGIYHVLKNGNFEVLENSTKPVKLKADFRDRSTALNILFFKTKGLRSKTYVDVENKDGINGKYFEYAKDYMSGIQAESFTAQMINYYLAKNGYEVTLPEEDDNTNPGETIFGESFTRNSKFEAEVLGNGFSRKFVSLTDIKQGWSVKGKKLKKLMEKVNKKFESELFNLDQIDFKKIRLYRAGFHVNIYDEGLEKINSFKSSVLLPIEERYKKERNCSQHLGDQTLNTIQCGDLSGLKIKMNECAKKAGDEERYSCSLDLLEKMLAQLEFKDFKNLIGENNIYVYATIDGFREKSEILNETIYSNTIGRIGSPDWQGPLERVKKLLGLSDGEFSGSWLRDRL